MIKEEEWDGLYDVIASDYWKMSQEQLKNILLEFIYVCNKEKTIEAIKNYNERISE